MIYVFVAGLWITFTDQFLDYLSSDIEYLSTLQTYKGWFYVLITGLGLYWLINYHDRQLISKEERLTNLLDELRSEKELKEILFERIPVFITIYDPDLETVEVNEEFEKVVGWSNEEIEKQDIDLLEACYPDLDTREEVVDFMNQPGVGWKEFSITTKSGEQIPTSWTNIRLTDNTSVGIGIDMTEIKASQTKIRESQKLLKKTFESLRSSLILINPENRTIINCNKGTEELFGYNREELIGNSTKKLHVNEEKYKEFDEMGTEALSEKGVFQTEFKMRKKDGTIFHSDHTVTLVHDEEGEVDKAVSVIRDITEQKNYEQKLKHRQERLLRSQKIGKIGDWELDPKTKDISWSSTMYEIFERDPDLGPPSYQKIQSEYYGKYSKKHNKSVQRAIEQGQTYDIDLKLHTDKGNQKFIRAIGIPIKNEEGETTKLQGIVQDITERKNSQKKLEQRNVFIETALENIPIGVAVNTIDNGKTTFINKKFTEIYGWPEEILQDVDSFFNHVYPDDTIRSKIRSQVIEDMQSGNPERMNWKGVPITTQDGDQKFVNNKAIPLPEQNLMISTVIDVTEQKNLEKKLRQSEKKYRHIFEDNPVPMWIYDPDTLEFAEVNKAAANHYGYTEEEFQNMKLTEIRPPEDVEKLKNNIKKHRSKKTYKGEWRHLKKDGTLINVEVSAANVQYKDETYRLALIHDITEQKNMQEKIIQSILEGEDRERKRIAHELHDGLGQYLVAANMNFESVKKEIGHLPEKRQNQFSTGLSHLKNGLQETRSIAYNLMPKTIADYGLVTALENMMRDFEKSTDIEFHFEQNCEDLQLKNQAEINIYRIFQEITSNAVRHSECTTIDAKLQLNEDTLTILIEDDGIGAELNKEHKSKGLGLRSIKTRVSSLKGTLDIDSQPGEGMTIKIIIPEIDKLLTNGSS